MVINMKENGNLIRKVDLVYSHSQTGHYMTANGPWDKSKDRASCNMGIYFDLFSYLI